MGHEENRASRSALRRLTGTSAPGVALAALVAVASGADASPLPASDAAKRQTVVAGHYPAGAFQRLMLGSGYRALWNTAVSVEVLDLQTEAGGLTPFRRVGGQQTHGLALTGADGRSYTFRGLDKDASHLLESVDPELKDTIVAKLLNDLMSAQHPASELVARGILEAIDIPCPKWRMVVMPDDPALGEFREAFAGAVGVFAPYPQPTKGDLPGFLGATEIIGHAEMYARLETGEGDAVDAQALLRARLVDILMGDWDRHRKQWRWAKVPGNPKWIPIPEDRDQAFSRYNGFVMGRARGTDPRFQNFGPDYAKIGGLTYNGSSQDRRLLVGLSREQFVATAKELQATLTDEAIERAVRRMPPEWYAIDGDWLEAGLKARRDSLADEAVKYHAHLARRVDVYMTNLPERVEAKRLDNGDMDVTVSLLVDGQPQSPYFHRVFDGEETEEVRFYALNGSDTVKVSGGRKGPRVRMIGGKGNDTLDAQGAGDAKLSDSEGQNRAIDAQDDSRPYTPPPPPKNAPWIPPRDWTRETVGVPMASYTGDIGLFLGYGIETRSFGFRKTPFANLHHISAGWGFKRGAGRVLYRGRFMRENRGSSFGMLAYASGMEVLRFYGFGNETPAPDDDDDFYKVDATQYLLYPTFKLPFAEKGLVTVGPVLKYTKNDENADQFINATRPYGWGTYGALALHGILSWDGRDNAVFPRKGIFAALRGTYFAKAWDVDSDFGAVDGNVNVYLSAGRAATFAFRVGGKKVYGDYPYMEGAIIGGGGLGLGALGQPENTVKGFRARRYLGDASAWANGEVRLRVSDITLVLPGDWGLTGFGDVGRVWLEGETSDTWHTGVGGGIWLSLLRDRMAFSAGIAHSNQDDIFYVMGGFSY